MAVLNEQPHPGPLPRGLIGVAAAAIVSLGLAGCGGGADSSAQSPGAGADEAKLTGVASKQAAGALKLGTPKRIASKLEVPWGIAFLPNGDALISERDSARILRLRKSGGKPTEVMKLPQALAGQGEGGLLGLAVSPRYAKDKLVYAYMTTASDNRIVRFKLGGKPKTILSGLESEVFHNGGRIAFGPDGKLYATVGDAGTPSRAQDQKSLSGKILRLNPNGSVPKNNPIAGSLIYSWGHRNPQGLDWDSKGQLWAAEFGQNKFDELNLIKPGANYGWPEVEGVGDTAGGKFTNPAATWTTDEASPSGVAIINDTAFVAGLRGERLLSLRLSGNGAQKTQTRFKGRFGRLRTVVRAPDGALWLTTSNRDGRGSPATADDQIFRIKVSK